MEAELQIAVCDDEQQQAQYIKMLVSKWADEKNIKININMFDSAENFKSARYESKTFDILLLDIEMNGQNGMELAREIRQSDIKLIIIFITGYIDYMSEGYDVSALHYLMKPIDTNKLYSVLEKAVKSITKGTAAIFLSVENESGTVRILTDDIIYAESFDHFLNIQTIREQHTVKMPLYEFEAKAGTGFIKCHRCYIVNLKYIKKITKTEITLDSNKTIPLSRRLYTEVNKAMIKYFTEGKK